MYVYVYIHVYAYFLQYFCTDISHRAHTHMYIHKMHTHTFISACIYLYAFE